MKYVYIIKAEGNRERAKKVTASQTVTESNTLSENIIWGSAFTTPQPLPLPTKAQWKRGGERRLN